MRQTFVKLYLLAVTSADICNFLIFQFSQITNFQIYGRTNLEKTEIFYECSFPFHEFLITLNAQAVFSFWKNCFLALTVFVYYKRCSRLIEEYDVWKMVKNRVLFLFFF